MKAILKLCDCHCRCWRSRVQLSAAKAGKCVMAGGEATMVTEDLAKFMAGAALKNSMAAHSGSRRALSK